MDDFEDLEASEFVTETDDQDSLDDLVELEQRRSNTQLWASFQNAACGITKLYKDRAQPTISPWVPFQSAASNLTSLYKDCIESQKRFAKLGYLVAKRRRAREYANWAKKHKLAKLNQPAATSSLDCVSNSVGLSARGFQQLDNSAPVLNVNQLQISCDQLTSNQSSILHQQQQLQQQQQQQQQTQQHQQQPQQLATSPSNVSQYQQLTPQHQNLHIANQHGQTQNVQFHIPNNEDDLMTFQQALTTHSKAQKSVSNSILANQKRSTRTINDRGMSEEEKLVELDRFLSEEYHRHVGSRKRSCSNMGGNLIKRHRDKDD